MYTYTKQVVYCAGAHKKPRETIRIQNNTYTKQYVYKTSCILCWSAQNSTRDYQQNFSVPFVHSSPIYILFCIRIVLHTYCFVYVLFCIRIDWFWLRGWLINKGAICTRTAPLFWIFISLFQNPRTRLVRKIGSQNQSIVLYTYCFVYVLFCIRLVLYTYTYTCIVSRGFSKTLSTEFQCGVYVAVYYSVLRCVAVCCGMLWCVVMCCDALPCIAASREIPATILKNQLVTQFGIQQNYTADFLARLNRVSSIPIHIHTHTYTYTYTYIHIHVHTHTCTYTYMYIHTHTHTHTYTHIYIYMYICTHRLFWKIE